MSEEIKEILDRLQNSVNYSKIDIPTFDGSDSEYIDNDTLLEPSKCKLLLNYITNLQKEKEELQRKYLTINENNQNMQEEMARTWKKCDDYKQRNEKAIEWCECVVNAKYTADKLPNGKTTDMGYCLDLAEPLLNILNGGDE